MANTAENITDKQEFWKPALASRERPEQAGRTDDSCPHCGIALLVRTGFCHGCGHALQQPAAASRLPVWFNLESMCEFLGQTTASLISLSLGTICVLAAVLTGFIYTASTLLDWQAVQIWRIEWLLAATAFFVAGILLKKK